MQTLISVEKLFAMCGIDWTLMKPGDSVDVSEKNVLVKSYDPEKQEVVRSRVNKLVRKENAPIYTVSSPSRGELFKGSPAHKIFVTKDRKNFEWLTLAEISDSSLDWYFTDYDSSDKPLLIKLEVLDYEQTSPILDFEIDKTHTYFANGVLSHNTTPGGNAMKYAASIRLTTRRKENVMDGDKMVGMVSHVKAIKNKVATPFQECDMKIIFGQGYQTDEEYLEAFVMYKLIDKAGSWITIRYSDDKGEVQTFKTQGLDKAGKFFKENPIVFEAFKRKAEELASKATVSTIAEESEDESKVIEEQTRLEAAELAAEAARDEEEEK